LQNADGSLKSKIERRRLVAKWFNQGFIGWQHRQAAAVPLMANLGSQTIKAA